MKYVKMIGFAAVAGMALTAFLGGTASATALCRTNLTEGCAAAGWTYPAGTEIHASLESGTTTLSTDTSGSITEDTCTTSTVVGKIENTGGTNETVREKTSALSFGAVGTPCSNTTNVLNGIGILEIHWISGTDNGTLTAEGFEWTVLSGVSCIFGAGTGVDLGTVTGGSMATIDIHAVIKKVGGGFLCPSTTIWDATYTVTSPEPLYLAKD